MLLVPLIEQWVESQPADRDPRIISMSSLGHCARQLAYRHHGAEGRPLDYRARATFADGDAHHELVREYLASALLPTCYRLVDQEKVRGKCDGVLQHDGACKEADHGSELLEVKSMGEYAFTKFGRERMVDDSYLIQASAYAMALWLTKIHFLVKNKNTSEMDEAVIPPNVELVEARLRILDLVLSSKNAEDLKREYGPSDKGNLPFQCGYCAFVFQCYGAENLKSVGRNKFAVVGNG